MCWLPGASSGGGCQASRHETDHGPLDHGFGVFGEASGLELEGHGGPGRGGYHFRRARGPDGPRDGAAGPARCFLRQHDTRDRDLPLDHVDPDTVEPIETVVVRKEHVAMGGDSGCEVY